MDFMVISFRPMTRKSQITPPTTKPMGINQKAPTSRNRIAWIAEQMVKTPFFGTFASKSIITMPLGIATTAG